MARKPRQRISYVLPLSQDASVGHRLGVNSLAYDSRSSLLYSAGRDGVLIKWNITPPDSESGSRVGKDQVAVSTSQHIQAHTDWINDIALAQHDTAVVSASSDTSVKVWMPNAQERTLPQTIGVHGDYVKCLASPSPQADWIASGGLDHSIYLWDLNGGGAKTKFDVPDERTEKGSVYTLAANDTIIASGGPENIVKLWDPRSGRRVTQLIGHTDNIRSILISRDSDTLLTAGSDRTIKVWSLTAGRCQYNMSMHNDSIWTLYSDHPRLSVFYSGDRSGLVAKTDLLGSNEYDQSVSVGVGQETEGINNLLSAEGIIWTATASSSLNGWKDIDSSARIQFPDEPKTARRTGHSRRNFSVSSQASVQSPQSGDDRIPISCVLRLPNVSIRRSSLTRTRDRTSTIRSSTAKKTSLSQFEADFGAFAPLRPLPEVTIEGQNGLIKHIILNDRRRVLTLDTAGEVLLWDILKCIPIRSYGKRDLSEVAKEINPTESVAHWCSVDTRTGALTCTLEERHCFDAEMYTDEVKEADTSQFREDQRLNLGKWVLHYLFSDFIHEELRRDEDYRNKNLGAANARTNGRPLNAPTSITIPPLDMSFQPNTESTTNSAKTPRAAQRGNRPLNTPALAIGIATPGPAPGASASPAMTASTSRLSFERTKSPVLGTRQSMERPVDYFSLSSPARGPGSPSQDAVQKTDPTPSEPAEDSGLVSPGAESERGGAAKESGTSFGKRLRSTFTTKKLGRSPAATEVAKPAKVDEKSDDSDNKSGAEETPNSDNILGVIEQIRKDYNHRSAETGAVASTLLTPALPTELPVLDLPLGTTVIIQQERAESAGIADLFEGYRKDLGKHADAIERAGPAWLGELLLKNMIPQKDIVKIAFVLKPYQNQLPTVTAEAGEERLNANRMLRARKIISYISERLEPAAGTAVSEELRPEETLELYCQDQLLPLNMTLATIRAHVWRSGGDVVLVYKPTGRKLFAPGSNSDQTDFAQPRAAAKGPAGAAPTPNAGGS